MRNWIFLRYGGRSRNLARWRSFTSSGTLRRRHSSLTGLDCCKPCATGRACLLFVVIVNSQPQAPELIALSRLQTLCRRPNVMVFSLSLPFCKKHRCDRCYYFSSFAIHDLESIYFWAVSNATQIVKSSINFVLSIHSGRVVSSSSLIVPLGSVHCLIILRHFEGSSHPLLPSARLQTAKDDILHFAMHRCVVQCQNG